MNSRDNGPLVFSLALSSVPLVVRLLSPGIPEAGDGLLHFQYARWCWEHPVLLLDLWAKPVFTLLASPFALLGAWGITLFNALCAGATAIGIGLIAGGRGARWLAPLMLITAPVYFKTVMGGMTEVLFGAASIGVVWLLVRHRIKHALMLASFMPLMRPEWMAFLPCVLVFAAGRRAWRELPWILLGSGVYAMLTFVVYGDPLRFFTRDPYAGNSTYGSGPGDHFIQHMDEVLGMPLIVLLVVCTAAWPVLWWKSEQRKVMAGMILITLIPALGVLLIHSYAWWKGGHGSLGLLRVLSTAIPLVVLFVLHTGQQVGSAWPAIQRTRSPLRPAALLCTVAVLGWWGIASLTRHIPMPIPQGPDQELLLRAGAHVRELDTAGRAVVCQDPLIIYAAGLDPFNSISARMIWDVDRSQEGLGLEKGDLLVWDGHFSPNEGGLSLERVMNDVGMRMVEMLVPEEDQDVLGGHSMEVYIFRRLPGQRFVSRDTLYALGDTSPMVTHFDTIACAQASGTLCFAGSEFPLTLEHLPLTGKGRLFDELVLTGELEVAPIDTVSLFIVFAENDGNKLLRYDQECVTSKVLRLRARIPPRAAGSMNKLYIWNRNGQPLALRSLLLTRTTWEQE